MRGLPAFGPKDKGHLEWRRDCLSEQGRFISKATKRTFIYMIQEDVPGGFLKIGLSADVKGRLQSLLTANPRPLKIVFVSEPYEAWHARKLEQILLGCLGNWHVWGEWVSAPLDVAVKIAMACDVYPQDVI